VADAESLARARSKELSVEDARAKGKVVADALRADSRCFQIEAALKAGMSQATYYRLLDAETDAGEAFQAEVLPALFEQARSEEERAERDIGTAENGSSAWGNWHKWRLEKRYRKLFGDLSVQKVELTGKDGGPVQSEATVQYVVTLPPEESE
jgi:hypothetical protein